MQVFYFLPSPTTDVQFNYDEPIVANAHRARGAASTCMLVNTRIIAKPRNRETAELCGEYHARTRCVARRNNNRCALNAKTRNERFSLLCEISIRWSSFEPRYSITRSCPLTIWPFIFEPNEPPNGAHEFSCQEYCKSRSNVLPENVAVILCDAQAATRRELRCYHNFGHTQPTGERK